MASDFETYLQLTRDFRPDVDYRALVSLDDMNRSGFENLGSGDNRVFDPTGSAGRKINAQGGDDDITLGSGDDVVYGGSGNDTIYTGTGNNTVYGGSGNDYVMGYRGADLIYGGTGNDELWGDQDASFSNLTGNDTLYGGSGNDILVGHSGADELIGGADADRFVYRVFNESTPGMRDHIADFNAAEGDRIDLSFLDANALVSGNQTFQFVGQSTGVAGQVWATGGGDTWTVFADLNGGGADMAIDVTLAGGATSMQASNFVL